MRGRAWNNGFASNVIDLTDVVGVTRGLVDIDSTTGREGDVVLWAATLLSQGGYEVLEQVVQGPRRNLYASFGKADVVFSTHLDCVPPFFSSKLADHSCANMRFAGTWGTLHRKNTLIER